jgi:esterase/lipase
MKHQHNTDEYSFFGMMLGITVIIIVAILLLNKPAQPAPTESAIELGCKYDDGKLSYEGDCYIAYQLVDIQNRLQEAEDSVNKELKMLYDAQDEFKSDCESFIMKNMWRNAHNDPSIDSEFFKLTYDEWVSQAKNSSDYKLIVEYSCTI